MLKTIYSELRKSLTCMSKFYENSVDRWDLMSKQSNESDWIFLNKQNPILTSPVAMATAPTLAKMRE